MSNFSPREIVSELDRFIIGQHDAKRAVAAPIRVAAVDKAPLAAGPAATEEAPRIRMLPLLLAITVMLGITAWPGALAGPAGAGARCTSSSSSRASGAMSSPGTGWAL